MVWAGTYREDNGVSLGFDIRWPELILHPPITAPVTVQALVSLIQKCQYLLGGVIEMALWSMCSVNIPITWGPINTFLAKPFLGFPGGTSGQEPAY